MSAAARRRFASACSLKVSNVVTDMDGDLLGRKRAVKNDDAVREQVGQLPVAIGDQAPEVLVLALDPVEAGRMPGPGRRRVDVEDEGAVGKQAAGHGEVELEDALGPEAAREPLVDARRV